MGRCCCRCCCSHTPRTLCNLSCEGRSNTSEQATSIVGTDAIQHLGMWHSSRGVPVYSEQGGGRALAQPKQYLQTNINRNHIFCLLLLQLDSKATGSRPRIHYLSSRREPPVPALVIAIQGAYTHLRSHVQQIRKRTVRGTVIRSGSACDQQHA